ncbi:MAG: DEAD/DEAH box helicase, partial [Neisseriaceae bacterium]|nr:DEAD/DEAH box helicase [Neisseriaceae bacterium]
MACGTGKTFTALKIAEEMAGLGKTVLFLVPSLSLLDQTISEWVQNSALPLHLWAVCSDSEVGKKKASELNDDDYAITDLSELQYPATTDAEQLSVSFHDKHNNQAMSVIFSTYHSLEVLREAQQSFRLPEFDLIICDEAHRTTGYAWEGDEISVFSKITDEHFVQGKKRLFMTATPRVYQSQAKEKEKEGKVELYSMDDEEKYGKDLYTLPFSKAVSQGLLVDYKVIVFSISEDEVADLENLQDAEISVSDAAKIVGCWKALSKQSLNDKEERNAPIMKRSVAFCTVIDNAKQKKGLVGSKQIRNLFAEVVDAYRAARVKKLEELSKKAGYTETRIPAKNNIVCEVEHIDGSMNAVNKKDQIQWLKDEPPENTCRILSNVRCLTEGVDVPALDAIMFLTPKSSKVDIVQAVGRVMRTAPNKQKGYVILPVVIPSTQDPKAALDKNENYTIVWEVLNALRSHDDEFDALLNRIDLMQYGELPPTDKIEVISYAELSQTAKPNKDGIGSKHGKSKLGKGRNIGSGASNPDNQPTQIEIDLSDEIDEISEAIYAKIVQKCGNTKQWEEWAEEVSVIAEKHIAQIKTILADKNNTAQIQAFETFSGSLKNDLNKSLSDEEIVQMLAQHIITEPVFKALFSGSPFVENNPVSQAIKPVLAALSVDTHWQDKKELQHFYDRVEMKIKGIKTLPARQALIKDLYDNFFNKAFSKMAEKLGIVYTPIEVVDFIIHSVECVMNNEFSGSLKDQGVHILDPFTGTGTFITRLLQSGIIPPEHLADKYQNDIHANEIVPLAYYIAAVNIESVFHDEMKKHAQQNTTQTAYLPFNGICLTDTFETHDYDLDRQPENSQRIKRQKEQEIRVIIGNPPYSAGQKSANDNNQNEKYEALDERIRQTYAQKGMATNKNSLHDTYIKAIRWASDSIGEQGVIGFITNAGWIDSNSADGLRKCLAEEFTTIYVLHLRGNIRAYGKKDEGGNIFGIQTPVAIIILVKNPNKQSNQKGQIYFHDLIYPLNRDDKLKLIQKYQENYGRSFSLEWLDQKVKDGFLTDTEKLAKIADFHDINGITAKGKDGWTEIIPDAFGDWINQRDPNFDRYISIGDKKDKTAMSVFETYSGGVKTNRDTWVYNFSCKVVNKNVEKTIKFYNSEVNRFQAAYSTDDTLKVEDFINNDTTQISWSRAFRDNVKKGKKFLFNPNSVAIGLYRPFNKQWLYYDKDIVNDLGQLPKIFPL